MGETSSRHVFIAQTINTLHLKSVSKLKPSCWQVRARKFGVCNEAA